VWITQDRRDQAMGAGYTVVDPTTAISTHLSESIRSFLPGLAHEAAHEGAHRSLAQTSAKLVEEIVPKVCSVGDVQRVLRQLLRERVPVRDLTTILEAMADAASVSKDPDVITEAVRSALGRSVCRAYQTRSGDLPGHRPVAGARGCPRSLCDAHRTAVRCSLWIPTEHSVWRAAGRSSGTG
jgi:flagellar biosynthesis protein FlhA